VGWVCQGKRGNGQACDDAGVCVSGFCADGVCCDSACTGDCQACSVAAGAMASGSCAAVAAGTDPKSRCGLYLCGGGPACPSSCAATSACAASSHCCGTACLPGPGASDGATCSTGTDCASCACTTFFLDGDHDGFGVAGTTARLCGTTPPVGWATVAGDCCDSDGTVHPGQTAFFGVKNACQTFDYDCNGVEQLAYPSQGTCQTNLNSNGSCYLCSLGTAGWNSLAIPSCGVAGTLMTTCSATLTCIKSSCQGVLQSALQPCR
jgi:hypothetical protein